MIEAERLFDDASQTLSSVQRGKSSLRLIGANKETHWCMCVCACACDYVRVVLFLCVPYLFCLNSVCTCDFQCRTGVRQPCASAIRFQSFPSIWLSCCGEGAPRGNVIIPCWPQSTGFTALSVSGETVASGPLLTCNIKQQRYQ